MFETVLKAARKYLALAAIVVGLTAVLDLPMSLAGISIYPQQYLGIFWGLITALAFLTCPRSASARIGKLDLALSALSLAVGLYVGVAYPDLIITIGLLTMGKTLVSALAIVLVLESVRRVAGWPLIIVVLAFIGYAAFGDLAPGQLQTTGIPWDRLLVQLFLGTDFLFGAPLHAAVLIVFSFILFGQLLFSTGGGELFLNLAHAAMGRYRGGPAKAAVLASAFFGTMSGSAVANVASTGTFTIPLMKRTGYQPDFAGAVEAVAATGGAIMPPIMGAAAFIMTEFLGVPYSAVVLAALVPALAYYGTLLFQVDLRAANIGLVGLPDNEVPRLYPVLRDGWIYLIPLVVLITAIFWFRQEVPQAALYACLANVLSALLTPQGRRAIRKIAVMDFCLDVARGMVQITIVCAGAGFVVGLVAYTGIGVSLADEFLRIAGGNIVLIAVGVALTSTILGMGMPATACYILVAILMAPALVKAGVDPLLAHLFAFYFGNLSFLTPPVALAVFAAASIAEAPVTATCLQALRLAAAGYIIPFMFLFKPGMALIGSVPMILWAVFDTALAVVFLAFALEGRCFRKVTLVYRVIFGVSALLMFIPGWESRIAGVVIGGVCMIANMPGGMRYIRSRG